MDRVDPIFLERIMRGLLHVLNDLAQPAL